MKIVESQASADGATRYLLETEDGSRVECIYLVMDHDGKDSMCISSQVGCAQACTFCVTGKVGFKRDMTCEEITDQVRVVLNERSYVQRRRFDVSFMGMGEPLMNATHVIAAARSIKTEWPDFNVYVSTVGVTRGIRRLTAEAPFVRLQISLHGATKEKRVRIMPITRSNPIDAVLEAGIDHAAVSDAPVTINYCLISGVNDGEQDANELVGLLRGTPFRVQLVKFNPHSMLPYSAPDDESVRQFKRVLEEAAVPVHYGLQLGKEAGAGCGQLDANYGRKALSIRPRSRS